MRPTAQWPPTPPSTMCFHLVTEREYLRCGHQLPMQRHYVSHEPLQMSIATDGAVMV